MRLAHIRLHRRTGINHHSQDQFQSNISRKPAFLHLACAHQDKRRIFVLHGTPSPETEPGPCRPGEGHISRAPDTGYAVQRSTMPGEGTLPKRAAFAMRVVDAGSCQDPQRARRLVSRAGNPDTEPSPARTSTSAPRTAPGFRASAISGITIAGCSGAPPPHRFEDHHGHS